MRVFVIFLLWTCTFAVSVYADDGFYKIGSSYTIKNRTYVPRHYAAYEEYGIASWYGKPFHGKKTANGEVFNLAGLTAAHRLLPMPSLVRVINLENGRWLVLKINDRGPFSTDDRVIDVSEFAAKLLGFHKNGLAKVKVVYLREATGSYIRGHRHYSKFYGDYRRTIAPVALKRNSLNHRGLKWVNN